MFYKRISDLNPLGKPTTVGGQQDWTNIQPIDILGQSQNDLYTVGIDTRTEQYNNTGSTYAIPWSAPEGMPTGTYLPGITAAFNNSFWYNTAPSSISGKFATVSEAGEDEPTDISTEYYAKSLWFEVAAAKTASDAPARSLVETVKYQSKRLNAYLLFSNIGDVGVNFLNTQYISSIGIGCDILSADIISATSIKTDSISANYADIASVSGTTIYSNAISSDIGIIDNISGTNLSYKNGLFVDVSAANITAYGIADLVAAAAYWADLAEIYVSDGKYKPGTLVKFGGENEITIADDVANAVVSEKPAILLNSGCKDEFATPIVLTGRSNVRVIHEVKKFDKIYLSEAPGLGCSEKYKLPSSTTPIGIALQSKDYDEEGLVECIIQLNFD